MPNSSVEVMETETIEFVDVFFGGASVGTSWFQIPELVLLYFVNVVAVLLTTLALQSGSWEICQNAYFDVKINI